jgi:hypothetical protein
MKLLTRQNQSASTQGQSGRNSQGRVAFGVKAFDSYRVLDLVELDQAHSSQGGSGTRIAFGEISRADWESRINSQAFETLLANATLVEDFFRLTPRGNRCHPSANNSISDMDSHREMGVDSFDLAPAQGKTFGGVDDRQTLIEKDQFRLTKAEVENNSNGKGDQSQFDTSSDRTCVPGTDINSRDKYVESCESDQIALWSEGHRITLASHVAIVSQKVGK